jgi:hypothetical protein
MARIIIIGEGQTEQSFCNDVLKLHFSNKNITIQNPVIKKTGGGIVNWQALKHQIETHLLEDQTAYVTTLIDYYGIYAHHKYPNWEAAEKLASPADRMNLIEQGMYDGIRNTLRTRFIPYIQLHEFEGLLFCDKNIFDNNFEENEFADYPYLESTISSNPNPEMINNGKETAPSKRLSRILKNYNSDNENNKVVYGSLLAQEIGLQNLRTKCPRFNEWINKLEAI